MVVNKVLQGHGDPLLLEVVLGLEKEIHHELETKDGDAASKGTRGLGERHLGIGDPLFKESERYHHAENDHVAGVAANVALHERLLKHNKHSSLFVQHVGSAYDPILQEYVMPKATLEELKALEDDIVHKRALFHELSVRKRYNLDEQELYCDPLVSKYRIQELMFRRSFSDAAPPNQPLVVPPLHQQLVPPPHQPLLSPSFLHIMITSEINLRLLGMSRSYTVTHSSASIEFRS
jgi:hypothetical protein